MSEIERLRGEKETRRAITLVYARCSTQKQKENLDRQVGRLLEYSLGQGWKPELFKDIGSGLNDNRKEFKKLLKRIPGEDVKRVLIEYKDRLCRYGFAVFQGYCEGLNVDVVILEEKEHKEFEQEFAQDVVALIASFSARLYGRRGGRKKKVVE
jgi:putative resolvase